MQIARETSKSTDPASKRQMKYAFLLFSMFFLGGCSSGSKAFVAEDVASEARIATSLASESGEFCRLLQGRSIPKDFPAQHLRDVGKQLKESKDELQQKEPTEKAKEQYHKLLAAYEQLSTELSAMDESLKKSSSASKACSLEKIDAIRTQVEGMRQQ